MKIVIIDYGAGNTLSVKYALQRLGANPTLTSNQEDILKADRVILPGVGHAKQAMTQLHSLNLVDTICNLQQPLMGLCLGMQLLFDYTEEGNQTCLGLIKGEVKRFPPKNKVPHMGWNNLYNLTSHLFDQINENCDVYFVHSYYAPLTEHTIATTDYIFPFAAAVQANQFYGCQFHPEKSGDIGEQILKNFLEI